MKKDVKAFERAHMKKSGDGYMELRARMQAAMEDAIEVAEGAARDWDDRFGRYHPLVEQSDAPSADVLLVTSGTMAGTARVAIESRRGAGDSVGLVKLRLFRPFPFEIVRHAVGRAKKLAVVDRNISFGHGGIMGAEIRAALCNWQTRRPSSRSSPDSADATSRPRCSTRS